MSELAPLLTSEEAQVLSRARQHRTVLALSAEVATFDALMKRSYLHKQPGCEHVYFMTSAGKQALALHTIYCQVEASQIGDCLKFEFDQFETAKRLKLHLERRYANEPRFWLKMNWIKQVGKFYPLFVQKLKLGGGQ